MNDPGEIRMPFCRAWGVMLVVVASVLSGDAMADSDVSLDEFELEFLQIINVYRAENGAPCLTPSPTMNAAADYMSRTMGELGFFDHNEPPCDDEGDICTGRDPFDRIAFFGHTGWSTAAENISAGRSDAMGTFEGWKSSEGHNRNMLDPSFTSIGIGRVIVPNSPYGVYWTNNFSNYIDGTGDCEGEGAGDIPVSGQGGSAAGPSDPTLGTLSGEGCHALGGAGSGLFWLVFVGGFFRIRRRWI
jgi:uncharacterized protein YkwD